MSGVFDFMRKKRPCIDCGKECHGKRCRGCLTIYRQPTYTRKEYRRNHHIERKYGLRPEEFDVYWTACRGKCFICEKQMKWPTSTQGQSLDVVTVDHNHKTGKVRGLLCGRCNRTLGFFNDDIDLLQKAINYLKGTL